MLKIVVTFFGCFLISIVSEQLCFGELTMEEAEYVLRNITNSLVLSPTVKKSSVETPNFVWWTVTTISIAFNCIVLLIFAYLMRKSSRSPESENSENNDCEGGNCSNTGAWFGGNMGHVTNSGSYPQASNLTLNETENEFVYEIPHESILNNYNPNMRIFEENLRVTEVISRGYFGTIYKGILKARGEHGEMKVLLKRLQNKYDTKNCAAIFSEFKSLAIIKQHPNIITLVGYTIRNSVMSLVLEYVDGGDLLSYLRKRRDSFQNLFQNSNSETTPLLCGTPETADNESKRCELAQSFDSDSLSTINLLSFAYQIAKGMEHIAALALVHRDLALRNVLVASDRTIRIVDFGLTRKTGNKEYYRVISNEALPILWTSPEAIKDCKFTEKSDVWSFAVCLYELFSLGETPYKNLGPTDMIGFSINGGILDKPEFASQEVYDYMLQCTNLDPSCRPSFSHCVEYLGEELKKLDSQILNKIEAKLQKVTENQKILATVARNLAET